MFLLIFQNSGIEPEVPAQGLEHEQPKNQHYCKSAALCMATLMGQMAPTVLLGATQPAGPWGCMLPKQATSGQRDSRA